MPVWEEQQLGNFSHGYPPQMPFQAPLRAASHSALYLSVDAGGDQLVGRAENGRSALHTIEHSVCAPNAAQLFFMCHGKGNLCLLAPANAHSMACSPPT